MIWYGIVQYRIVIETTLDMVPYTFLFTH